MFGPEIQKVGVPTFNSIQCLALRLQAIYPSVSSCSVDKYKGMKTSFNWFNWWWTWIHMCLIKWFWHDLLCILQSSNVAFPIIHNGHFICVSQVIYFKHFRPLTHLIMSRIFWKAACPSPWCHNSYPYSPQNASHSFVLISDTKRLKCSLINGKFLALSVFLLITACTLDSYGSGWWNTAYIHTYWVLWLTINCIYILEQHMLWQQLEEFLITYQCVLHICYWSYAEKCAMPPWYNVQYLLG